MPRRNRAKPTEAAEVRFRSTTSPLPAPDGWLAERYRGGSPGRDYVCPRCARPVARSSDHVVAWRTEEDERHRHWHAECWRAAVREGLDRYRWS